MKVKRFNNVVKNIWSWKKSISTFYLLLVTFHLVGQDIHFSQFYNSPLNQNPGNTGAFVGDLRVVANQRTQWRSVTTPYSTFGVAIDGKPKHQLPINLGLGVYNDKAGDSQFSTFQIAPSISYTKYIADSTQTLTIGIQPAYTQRRINYNELNFDNQFNGFTYDESLGNGENFSNEGRNYLNIHTGITWNYVMEARKQLNAGIALHNLFNPKQSFFNDANITLNKRFTFHTEGLFAISEKVDALPRVSFMRQGQFNELIFGGSGKYHLNNGNYKAVYLGLWYRNKDASYLTAELDYGNFHFGVSYDFNLSTLKTASRRRGGFEFALIYIFEKYRPTIKRYKACPNFI